MRFWTVFQGSRISSYLKKDFVISNKLRKTLYFFPPFQLKSFWTAFALRTNVYENPFSFANRQQTRDVSDYGIYWLCRCKESSSTICCSRNLSIIHVSHFLSYFSLSSKVICILPSWLRYKDTYKVGHYKCKCTTKVTLLCSRGKETTLECLIIVYTRNIFFGKFSLLHAVIKHLHDFRRRASRGENYFSSSEI